ncbi:MAG: hypothetical protein E7321_08385 [Clostridiales bacterium]|nr:hypothetical protein [Clostridiales bacterium]
MNAKKNTRILAAAALCAAMTIAPVSMLAAETSAHVPNSVEAQEIAERLPSFRKAGPYRGVNVSNSWLRQARLGGVMLNLRLHTPMGDEVTFREMLKAAPSDPDSMCLYLQASQSGDVITMQLDQPAVDALNNLGIVEIVVADLNRYVRAHYMVSELEAVRAALGLEDAEQLCVSGEDAPVTVVSEDGVRRQVNP